MACLTNQNDKLLILTLKLEFQNDIICNLMYSIFHGNNKKAHVFPQRFWYMCERNLQ